MKASGRAAVSAFGFLSRVRMPTVALSDGDAVRGLAWFPAVGALIGAVAGAVAIGAAFGARLGLEVSAALTLVVHTWLSGGLHLDGLSDTVDGLSAGGRDRQRVFSVMSDSRIGAHGAVALGLLLLVKWSLFLRVIQSSVPPWAALGALMLASALGRAACALTLALLTPAKPSGLAHLFRGRGAAGYACVGGFSCLLGAVLFASVEPRSAWRVGASIASVAGCAASLAGFFRRRLGGHTGDTLGAVVELSEVAALLGWCCA